MTLSEPKGAKAKQNQPDKIKRKLTENYVMAATDNITFSEVRCSLCGQIAVEVGNNSEAVLRSKCKRCRAILIIDCHIGVPPKILETQHKAFTNQSKV
jgi:phage FluMu protein Com